MRSVRQPDVAHLDATTHASVSLLRVPHTRLCSPLAGGAGILKTLLVAQLRTAAPHCSQGDVVASLAARVERISYGAEGQVSIRLPSTVCANHRVAANSSNRARTVAASASVDDQTATDNIIHRHDEARTTRNARPNHGATGWQAHTVRGLISILGSKGRHIIESTKNAAGQRTYRTRLK